MKRRLPVAAYLLVVAMTGFGLWRLETEINAREAAQRVERLEDCEQSRAARAQGKENQVAFLHDIADAVNARGGTVNPELVDDIATRIQRRYDQLPPPADCDP